MTPDYSRYRYLAIQRDNGIATLTLNQPDNRNAIHAEMHAELEHVWLDLAADAEVNVIVLTGAGKIFSAGGDIKRMVEPLRHRRGLAVLDRHARLDQAPVPEHPGGGEADHRRHQRRRGRPRRHARAVRRLDGDRRHAPSSAIRTSRSGWSPATAVP